MLLFVGNLGKLITESELIGLFSTLGVVSKLRIMVDSITRRSCGYAYVDMEQEQQALDAVRKLNATAFMGSYLIVGVASGRQQSDANWV